MSISGRSVSFNDDDIEMEDSKPTDDKIHRESNSDEDDSDGVQYISIKVTNPDGSVQEGSSSEIEGKVPKKSVQMFLEQSPKFDQVSNQGSHLDEHSYGHSKVETPFQEFGKTFFLVFIWIIMIAFLTSTPEKKIGKRQLVVPNDAPKFYNLPHSPNGTLIHITLQAPFLPDPKEYPRTPRRLNNQPVDTRNKENSLVIYLQTASMKTLTPNKTFYVYKPHELDLANTSKIDFIFDIGEDNLYELNDEVVQAVIISNFSKTPDRDKPEVPITLQVDFNPINKPIGVLFAAFTLILLYALIVWEVRCDYCLLACLFVDPKKLFG